MSKEIEINKKITFRFVKKHLQGDISGRLLDRHSKAFKFFIKYAKDKNAKILDIGTRDGLWLERLRDHGFTNLYGLDISEEAVNFAKRKGFNCILSSAYSIPFTNIDIITVSHVLEHCSKPEKVINEIYKSLVPKGKVFIEVPIEKNKKNKDKKFGHFHVFTTEKSVLNLLGGFIILDTFLEKRGANSWFRIMGVKK